MRELRESVMTIPAGLSDSSDVGSPVFLWVASEPAATEPADMGVPTVDSVESPETQRAEPKDGMVSFFYNIRVRVAEVCSGGG